ncbi:MAG TPA: cyclopropane-fatty-acyl-phospholipid synthase family protein [Rhizomicrobium sp.]|nr:cyclopropane-fatty-acyl-phospholipid synthase family protein [Rhizomicrobium sp.]
MRLLARFLRRFVTIGSIGVIDADDAFHSFGDVPQGERPDVIVALRDRSLHWKLAIRPELYLGEAYMDGSLEITRGTLADLLRLCCQNLAEYRNRRSGFAARNLVRLGRYGTQWNSRRQARENASHHYDLSSELYCSFLDQALQYSCAYFPNPELTLDEAQSSKMRHLAAKLLLKRNQRVLDVGCGWGGLAIDLARRAGVRVDGITLSREQLALASKRADAAGVGDDVRFYLKDYRELDGCYDRIVSVGMFEHVGLPHYSLFFRKLRDLLAADGIAVVHSIGSASGWATGNPWIRKYIFPGGYIPALSEVVPAVESSGLIVTDIEILHLHYAETLQKWRERFLANWRTIKHIYDERFRRMWEFYLASSEMAFRHGRLMVFQLQLARQQDAVPLTRDYIFEFERSEAMSSSGLRECAA